MNIITFDTLLSEIRHGDETTASKLLKQYGDNRAEKAIEYAWNKATSIMKHAANARERRIKNHLVEFNDEQSMIDLINFSRFFSAVEDRIKKHMNTENEELRDALAEINDYMYQKLGKIRLDRRLNFSGGDYEEFLKD